MNEFIRGFVEGAKETPRGYFAPLVAIWRLFFGVTESLVSKTAEDSKQRRHA